MNKLQQHLENAESLIPPPGLSIKIAAQQFAANLELLVSREIHEAVHFKTELCDKTYKMCISFQLSKTGDLSKVKSLVRDVSGLPAYQNFDVSFESHPHGRGIIRLEPNGRQLSQPSIL